MQTSELLNMTEDQYERHLDTVENTIRSKAVERGCTCNADLDGRDCMCFEGSENYCFMCNNDVRECTCKKCTNCGNEAKYECRC